MCFKNKEHKNIPLIEAMGQQKSLFGMNWIREIPLGLDLENLFSVNEVKTKEDLQDLLGKFKDVFGESLGTEKRCNCFTAVRTDATPKFCPPLTDSLCSEASRETRN